MIAFKKHVSNLLFLILMLICFALALLYSSKSKTTKNIQMLSTTDNILDGSTAMNMQNTEKQSDSPIHFTIWGEVQGGRVENNELSRSADVNTLFVKGDSNLVYDNAWNLGADDIEGCLLSENVIYQLYGHNNVTGTTIEYNGRSLIIRGIIKGSDNLLIVQALSDTDKVMNHVSIEIGSGEKASDVVQEFNNRYPGFTNQINIQSYSAWANGILGILPIVMLFSISIPLSKYILTKRQEPAKFILYAAVFIGYLGLFLWTINFQFNYPQDMIPPKWSDFSFWSTLYQQKSDEMELLLRTEKNVVEMAIIQPFLQTIKYSVFGIILFIISVRKIKIAKAEELLLYSVICLFTSFVIICSQTFESSEIDVYRPIWLLLLIYLFGKLLISKFEMSNKNLPNAAVQNIEFK